MVNKYDQYNFKTETLIKAIQETAVRLSDPKLKKKMSSAVMIKQSRELNEMRTAVIGRLKGMDRMNPEFFPIGCIVLYSFPYSQKGPLNAVVLARDGPKVIIRLEGEVDGIKVEPNHLTIKHIRSNT